MRILVIGATGFIGSALDSRLASEGDEVVSVSRGKSATQLATRHFAIGMACAEPRDWLVAPGGVDAVVNCAGVFQSDAGVSA